MSRALEVASLYGLCIRRQGIFLPLSRGLLLSTLKYLSYVRRASEAAIYSARSGGGATKRAFAEV